MNINRAIHLLESVSVNFPQDTYQEAINMAIEVLSKTKTGHIEMASSGVFTPTVWAMCSKCKKPIDLWDNYCRSCGVKIEREKHG